MSVFSSYKKIFLLGFIVMILIAIPFSVYIAQKRQGIRSKAAASTTLSFYPASSAIKVGDTLILNVALDPGTGPTANQVSFVKLSINYDPTKFARTSESDEILAPNTDSANTLTSVLENPVYTSGSAYISLSIGADPTRVVTTKTQIVILKLKALSVTDSNNPTSITFDKATQVLSIASSDQTSENVLSTTTPATITINPALPNLTPTPTPTLTPPPGGIQPSTPIGLGTVSAALTPTPIVQSLQTQIPLPPTGPEGKILGIGVIGVILTIIGGTLFILL